MNSRFYFSYATSFFFALFLTCYFLEEPGEIIGKTVFALSLALFYKAANCIKKIQGIINPIYFIILVVYAVYILSNLELVYIFCFLAAFIPFLSAAYVEDKVGSYEYKLIAISSMEVFGLLLGASGLMGFLVNKFSPNATEYIYKGCDSAILAGIMCVNFLYVIFLITYMFKYTTKGKTKE